MYEVKFDGYRALILKNGDKVQIRSRNDRDMTATYPPVAAAARRLGADRAVVDGEIVAVDARGQPSFQALQHRAAHKGHSIVFYAFDLLHLAGEDLTGSPLEERRKKLPEVLGDSGVLMSIELPGSAAQVIEAVRGLGLEGVIAKRRKSRYGSGRSDAWLKLKLDRQQEFVVGGYRPGPNGVDSLLVGYYNGKALHSPGRSERDSRRTFAGRCSSSSRRCTQPAVHSSISRAAGLHTGAAASRPSRCRRCNGSRRNWWRRSDSSNGPRTIICVTPRSSGCVTTSGRGK